MPDEKPSLTRILCLGAGCLLGATLIVTGIVQCGRGCQAEREREWAEKIERRRAMQGKAVALATSIAASRGEVVRVDCKETETDYKKTWSLQECSAVLADGRWMRIACDIGNVPGCRIDWIGREGGPIPKAEEESE